MYKPYQIVALYDGSVVELMSFPWKGEVFARTVVGDATSAKYIKTTELREVLFPTGSNYGAW